MVDDELRVYPQRPGNNMTVGAFPGLLGREQAGAYLFRNDRVVLSHRDEYPGPELVGAAVAHVGQIDRLFPKQEGRHRGPHAEEGGVNVRGPAYQRIRKGKGAVELSCGRIAFRGNAVRRRIVRAGEPLPYNLNEPFDRHAACHFTAFMAADAVSHRLLLRAGYVRQLGAGIYSLLPLGWRVTRPGEQNIRGGMDRIGCPEMGMPGGRSRGRWKASS